MDASSSPFSLFPSMDSTPPEIPDELFKLFHTIDRELYARLLALGRKVPESVQMMAFWMWLEKESKDMNLFDRLLSLPAIPILTTLVEETILCLHCINSDTFLPFRNQVLVLLPDVVNARISGVMNLNLFHDNCVAISRSISKIANTVCARAFRNISLPQLNHVHYPPPPPPHFNPHHEMMMNMNNQLMEEININNIIDDGDVPPDDRTIFLTFSKGYPISAEEVTEFFTRRFGDFIEDLIMQDVGNDEQVLYARMVARSATWINEIVGGNKAKYVINGKHVWARKYVKKQHQFPPQARSQDPSAVIEVLLWMGETLKHVLAVIDN